MQENHCNKIIKTTKMKIANGIQKVKNEEKKKRKKTHPNPSYYFHARARMLLLSNRTEVT